MSGCARVGPTSVPPTITPAPIVPTAIASQSPTPALITPTAATSAVTTPPPTPAAPTPIESGSLPAILADVDLGVRFEQPLQHALALDVDGGRLFVSAPPDRTLVLSTEDWRITDTLPLGGDVAIDRAHERLFIGAPGGVSVFDLDGLRLMGTIPITADLFGSTPIPDESTGKLFVVHNGVYVAYPTALPGHGAHLRHISHFARSDDEPLRRRRRVRRAKPPAVHQPQQRHPRLQQRQHADGL